MNQLKIDHPVDGASKTYLTAETAIAATTSTVENSSGFATNDLVRFGELGEERAEIITLTSVPSATSIGHTTGPSFLQRVDVPIYEMNYNQVQIYSSTSKDGAYTLLDTIALSVGSDYTIYQDADGDNDTWYKTRYKNSVTTTYSGYSAATEATGYPINSFGFMQEMVGEELGDPKFEQYERSLIKKYLRKGQMVLALSVAQLHGHHLVSYTTQALTTGTSIYDLPTNFMSFRKVTVNFNGGATNRTARFKREDATIPTDTFTTDDPILFLRGSQFFLQPTGSIATGGTVYMWYHKAPVEMIDDDDEDGFPYGASSVLVPYACYRALQHKGEVDRATIYKDEYKESRTDYLQMLSESGQDTNPKEVMVLDSDLYDLADYEAY